MADTPTQQLLKATFSKECAICLGGDFTQRSKLTMVSPCKHSFCSDCFSEALVAGLMVDCPYCRTPVKRVLKNLKKGFLVARNWFESINILCPEWSPPHNRFCLPTRLMFLRMYHRRSGWKPMEDQLPAHLLCKIQCDKEPSSRDALGLNRELFPYQFNISTLTSSKWIKFSDLVRNISTFSRFHIPRLVESGDFWYSCLRSQNRQCLKISSQSKI